MRVYYEFHFVASYHMYFSRLKLVSDDFEMNSIPVGNRSDFPFKFDLPVKVPGSHL